MYAPVGRSEKMITALFKTLHIVGQPGVNTVPSAAKTLCANEQGFSAAAQNRLSIVCIVATWRVSTEMSLTIGP